jgi:hypothetical protein
MRDHIALMRAVGYRYRSQESRYRSFDRFLQSQPALAGKPLETLIEAWTGATPTKAHAGQCELVGRLLSRVMHRLDPRDRRPSISIEDFVAVCTAVAVGRTSILQKSWRVYSRLLVGSEHRARPCYQRRCIQC